MLSYTLNQKAPAFNVSRRLRVGAFFRIRVTPISHQTDIDDCPRYATLRALDCTDGILNKTLIWFAESLERIVAETRHRDRGISYKPQQQAFGIGSAWLLRDETYTVPKRWTRFRAQVDSIPGKKDSMAKGRAGWYKTYRRKSIREGSKTFSHKMFWLCERMGDSYAFLEMYLHGGPASP